MGRVVVCLTCLALGQAAGAPVKTIEDGVLDKMVLYVETLDNPTSVPVVMRPFDASMADLGTGNKGGKATRQEEARTMQSEGPRVLAERFATALQNSGPFKSVRVLKVDEDVPDGAILVEGKFVTLDPGSRAKRSSRGSGQASRPSRSSDPSRTRRDEPWRPSSSDVSAPWASAVVIRSAS